MLTNFALPDVPVVMFWGFVCAAILIQGISKSGFAGGAGILSLPLMMLVMPVDKVAATMLPLLILCDMNAIYIHRHNKVWRAILSVYLPSIAGIVLGALVWWWVGQKGVKEFEGPIKTFCGVIAILFAIYIVIKETALHWVERFRPGTRVAIGAGVAAGFTSTIAHAAGPIVGLYLFSLGLGKTLFTGSVAWTFTLINLTKLPFYVGVGLVKTDVLLFDALLIWLIPIGSYLGKWMHGKISDTVFNRIIFVLTLIAGIQLLVNVNLVLALYEWVMGVF